MAFFTDQLKQVFRRLVRAPLFTTITLITLAVGIGANTVVFSVVEGVLLKPLAYPQADRLVGIWHSAPEIGFQGDLNMAPFLYFIDREQSTTLEDVGMYDGDSLSVTGAGEPEHVTGMDVTDGTLPLLGVKPVLGRLFTRRDDSASAPKTIILSYDYWQKKFGGSNSVVGRTLNVDGTSREIIGVLPRNFQFLDNYDAALFLAHAIGPQQSEARQLQLSRTRPPQTRRDIDAGQHGYESPAADCGSQFPGARWVQYRASLKRSRSAPISTLSKRMSSAM